MKEHLPVIVWISVLGLSCALIIVMAVFQTIALHPDAAGFIK